MKKLLFLIPLALSISYSACFGGWWGNTQPIKPKTNENITVQTPITDANNGQYGWLTNMNTLSYADECSANSDKAGLNFGSDGTLYKCFGGINTALTTGAPLLSPNFTGTPTAPTAPNGTNTTQIATTAFVQSSISGTGQTIVVSSDPTTPANGSWYFNTTTRILTYYTTAGRYDFAAATYTASGGTDTTPDTFTFTDITGANLNTAMISNAITVTGVTAATPIPISVTGSTGYGYSKNSGACTSTAGTVVLNDTVAACVTSSSSELTATAATVTIGGAPPDTYTVTTKSTSTSEIINPTGTVGGWNKVGAATNLVTITDNDDATYFTYSSTSVGLYMGMTAPVSDNPIASIKFCARMSWDTAKNKPRPRLRLHNSSTSTYASFTPDPVVLLDSGAGGGSFTDYCSDNMTVDPLTSAAWTKADITGVNWRVDTGTQGTITLNASKVWAIVNY